jgi:hypothetical protein
VYVVLTWRLVRVDRQATKEAQTANTLAQEAITASQEANKLAQEALNNDRRQYALAVKNQQDAAMPAVIIRFTGRSLSQREGSGIGNISVAEFRKSGLSLNSSFDVVNHGPGPALVWAEVATDFDAIVMSNPFPAGEPAVISAVERQNTQTITVSFFPDGSTVLDEMTGREYARVTLRWAAYSQRDVIDSASYRLRLEQVSPSDDQVNQSFFAALIAYKSELLIPGKRSYPDLPPDQPQGVG